MKPLTLITSWAALSWICLAWTGCGQKPEETPPGPAGDDGPPAMPAGASFQPGRGVLLTDEMKRGIGLETAEVSERTLPWIVQFDAQVFGEDHREHAAESFHAECTAKAAGLVSQEDASRAKAGAPAALSTKAGLGLGGFVLGVTQALALGDVEVVVGVTNSGAALKPGDFLSVTLATAREQPVPAIPRSAVFRPVEGTFAYVEKEGAYRRISIKTGAASKDFVEVVEGLSPGEVVVTRPVEKLWLIELWASTGGGHSH